MFIVCYSAFYNPFCFSAINVIFVVVVCRFNVEFDQLVHFYHHFFFFCDFLGAQAFSIIT
ncbi:hypothetical protein D6T91_00930 [Salmonella enterica subsp. houtenae]|nr:hypothetical protein [Salmonella enterica subsp. houtenae]